VAPRLVGRGAPDLVALPAVADLRTAPRLVEPEWRQVGDDMLLQADVEVT
jgi:riboflavin biosynthesis pyrimidine reductase